MRVWILSARPLKTGIFAEPHRGAVRWISRAISLGGSASHAADCVRSFTCIRGWTSGPHRVRFVSPRVRPRTAGVSGPRDVGVSRQWISGPGPGNHPPEARERPSRRHSARSASGAPPRPRFHPKDVDGTPPRPHLHLGSTARGRVPGPCVLLDLGRIQFSIFPPVVPPSSGFIDRCPNAGQHGFRVDPLVRLSSPSPRRLVCMLSPPPGGNRSVVLSSSRGPRSRSLHCKDADCAFFEPSLFLLPSEPACFYVVRPRQFHLRHH